MKSYTVFVTPGKLDLNALKLFGVNVKPNTNTPIGYFGTGLKYAIAVLVRMDIEVTVFTDGAEYVFYAKKGDFRGKKFDFVRMRRRNSWLSKWTYEQLPFTTELGKNWELWQVFRELYANTLDEKGEAGLSSEQETNYKFWMGTRLTNQTYIVVEGEKFAQEYRDREKTFLPESRNTLGEYGEVEIIAKPSKHLYFRGMRVADLDKPSIYTYNIVGPLELTEDRTVKYMFYARWHIRDALMISDNEQQIEAVVTASKGKFEYGLEWGEGQEASEAFKKVLARNRARLSPYGLSYYGAYLSPAAPQTLAERLRSYAADLNYPPQLRADLLSAADIVESVESVEKADQPQLQRSEEPDPQIPVEMPF